MKRRPICILMVLCLTLSLFAGAGCKGKKDKYPVDAGYLYGMDYIVYEGIGNGIPYDKGFELMNNLGVKSIRNWMHVVWFYDDNLNPIQANIDTMHDIIAEAEKYSIQLIGMSHHNINDSANSMAKPFRDVSAGSYYLDWLDTYEESWYLMASEFDGIKYWEIDNECNNADFMPRIGGGSFTARQMAEIFTDMLYYASKGIKRGNPNAVTVMGGLTDSQGLGSGQTTGFLKLLYENIKSGKFGEGSTDPDDYFECAAWHPYTRGFDKEKFIKGNNDIYDIIYKNEGKHKKVFLTEIGGFDMTYAEEAAANYVKEMMLAVKELPYVEAMHYYRDFNNVVDNYNSGGIFYDPNPARVDYVRGESSVRATPGKPKLSAYAFQEVAGGTGSLTVLQTEVD